MKKAMITATLVICLTLSLFAKKPVDFSGSWKLDVANTEMGDSQLWLEEIVVTQTKDSLLSERTYQNENYETFPFTENLTLDGKEYDIVVYDIPRKTSVTVSEDKMQLVVTSQITFWGDNGEVTIPMVETWSLKEKGKVLSMDYASVSPDGEFKTVLNYKKAE